MKQFKIFFILLILPWFFTSSFSQLKETYRITAEEMTEKPISPLLYSNFIELGYGIQVEPMWSEMLWNRSFEKFVPYKGINITWYDLWIDYEDQSKGYKTDWSSEDWYHSGYEHNPWFAAPGTAGLPPIDENSTFFINKNPESSVILEQVSGGIHGEQYLIAKNTGKKEAAVAQEGKFLNAGNVYAFSGHFQSKNAPLEIELRMYPEGDWSKPILSVPLSVEQANDFQHLKASFHNSDFTGRATFSLWIPGNSEIGMDAFSLMPKNTLGGWRPEAVAVADYVNPGVVRFPGGCFASFYNWRDGIGPQDERKPQPSYFWGGLNYNDVGVAELARFCQAIGSQMMYCVNVFHPYKEEWDHRWDDGTGFKMGFEFPHFTDVEQGAREAADLVAYCNLPAGSHPMADLRVEHGHPEPFGIQFWEMDNEVHRWFAPEEYARAVSIYSKAMKAMDPSIRIGLVTYGGRPGQVDYGKKVPEMLEICGKDIDFLADRRDADAGLDNMLSKLRDYEKKSGRYIAYCETEKLFMDGKINFNDNLVDGFANKSYQFSKWFYALNVLKSYMAYQRRGGDVLFVNFNNLANCHSQNVLDTPKEGAYVTAAGEALSLLSRSPAAWPLVIKDYEVFEKKTEYVVQAAWSDSKEELVIYVLNRTDDPRIAILDIQELGKTFAAMETTILSADSHAMNTMKAPDNIKKTFKTMKEATIRESVEITADPYTFTQIVLKKL
ncbi:MAG: hypothetical protein IH594_01110 [Bacteroidales bacterium]|nr:hypothetical protein [Bacteroidales bacterium]